MRWGMALANCQGYKRKEGNEGYKYIVLAIRV